MTTVGAYRDPLIALKRLMSLAGTHGIWTLTMAVYCLLWCDAKQDEPARKVVAGQLIWADIIYTYSIVL